MSKGQNHALRQDKTTLTLVLSQSGRGEPADLFDRSCGWYFLPNESSATQTSVALLPCSELHCSAASGYLPDDTAETGDFTGPKPGPAPAVGGETSENPVQSELDGVQAARYERIRLRLTLANLALSIALPLVFLLAGWSEELRNGVEDWTDSAALIVLIYVVVISVALELFTFPLDIYSGYVVEKRFNLSRSTLSQWFTDWAKGEALQLVFIVGAIELIYYLLRELPGTWWLVAGAGFTLFFVVLSALAPVLLFRLFFKFEPLPDGELKDRLLALSERLGVYVRGVYIWKLGDKTRKANAALAGWGRTRRILLADTLLDEHTSDEIEVVLAHEMAHQVHNDIWKGLAIQTALVFLALFVVHIALEAWTEPLGLRSVSDIANLPLLLLVTGAVTLLALPVANGLSRKMEHAADVYALEKTGMAAPFASAMERLAKQNLSQKRPNRIVEFILHSHPAVESRIEFAKDWQRRHGTAPDAADATTEKT